MAERLKTFDFTAPSAITSAVDKGSVSYPWGDWFDGDIWKLTEGEDFYTHPLMMERIIRTRATSRKAKVTLRHISANGDAPAIVLQRLDVTGPTSAKKAETAAKRQAKRAQAAKEAEDVLAKAGITPVKDVDKATKTLAKASKPAKPVAKVVKSVKKPSTKK